MHAEVHYLREDQLLSDTLEEIFEPSRHLFIVVNDLKEYAGVITSEEILKQIIGQPVPDELADYEPPEEAAGEDNQISTAAEEEPQ